MKDFSKTELEDIARAAHNLAYDAFQALPEDAEPDYTRVDLERVAMEELKASALYAPAVLGQAEAEVIWTYNYYRGWRFGESDAYDFEQPTIDIGEEESEQGSEGRP